MDIIISNSSGRPIYDQISEQIKEKILTGQLEDIKEMVTLAYEEERDE